MRRRILLVSALSAAIMITTATAAFAQSQPAADFDLGNLLRILFGILPAAGNIASSLV